MLGSELVFADEMRDTVNNLFLMYYIITELLVDDELIDIQKQFEQYNIFPCYGKPHYFPFIEIFKDLGINVVLSFDEDKTSNENNNKINIELQKNKHYMFNNISEKEIGYNDDKGSLPKFLDYLTNYDDYERYFAIVND